METKGQNILITGGSGLVGQKLTSMLLKKGHRVLWLSRSIHNDIDNVNTYQWDIKKMKIDRDAIEWADAIIHLAGEGVANKRWTNKQKKKIWDSRVYSTRLLYGAIKEAKNPPSKFISASAIGYYGLYKGDQLLNEDTLPGNDFLAQVTKAWEHEVNQIVTKSVDIVKLRIGIVLSRTGGALEKMSKPIRYGVGAALGSGNQIMSWIHIDDLCNMIEFALDNNLSGTYNAVSCNPVTNKEMTKTIATKIGKPLFLPPVPAFILRIMLGKMSEILVTGANVSSQKIKKSGFNFKYPNLDVALEELLR